jgi:hypothetical protein
VRSRLPGGRLAARFSAAFTELATVAGTDVTAADFWVEASQPQDGLWGRMVDDFHQQYITAYQKALGELFGSTAPSRLRLNGGMAQHLPWFRERFGNSLGLPTVAAPAGDLAIRGVARLLADNHFEESDVAR